MKKLFSLIIVLFTLLTAVSFSEAIDAPVELRKWIKGQAEAVEKLQTRLSEMGYYDMAIDAIYGDGTARAVEMFQERNGLEVTGVASEETLALLYSDEGKSNIKNLIENLKKETSVSSAGVEYQPLDDGRYTIAGATSEKPGVFCLNPLEYIKDEQMPDVLEPLMVLESGKTYYISGCQVCYIEPDDKTVKYYTANRTNPSAKDPMVVMPEVDQTVLAVRAFYSKGAHDGSIIFEPMITEQVPIRYESYSEE